MNHFLRTRMSMAKLLTCFLALTAMCLIGCTSQQAGYKGPSAHKGHPRIHRSVMANGRYGDIYHASGEDLRNCPL